MASYVVQAWEVDPSEASINEIATLMHHLLSTTASKHDHEDMATILMEYAHKQQSSMPTPCPNLTLLVAIQYIDRLKKVIHNKGTAFFTMILTKMTCRDMHVFVAHSDVVIDLWWLLI